MLRRDKLCNAERHVAVNWLRSPWLGIRPLFLSSGPNVISCFSVVEPSTLSPRPSRAARSAKLLVGNDQDCKRTQSVRGRPGNHKQRRIGCVLACVCRLPGRLMTGSDLRSSASTTFRPPFVVPTLWITATTSNLSETTCSPDGDACELCRVSSYGETSCGGETKCCGETSDCMLTKRAEAIRKLCQGTVWIAVCGGAGRFE